jgi:hypothetical protein
MPGTARLFLFTEEVTVFAVLTVYFICIRYSFGGCSRILAAPHDRRGQNQIC